MPVTLTTVFASATSLSSAPIGHAAVSPGFTALAHSSFGAADTAYFAPEDVVSTYASFSLATVPLSVATIFTTSKPVAAFLISDGFTAVFASTDTVKRPSSNFASLASFAPGSAARLFWILVPQLTSQDMPFT